MDLHEMIRKMSQDQYEHFIRENPGGESRSVYTDIEITRIVAKQLGLGLPIKTRKIFVRTFWKNSQRGLIIFRAWDGKNYFPIEIWK